MSDTGEKGLSSALNIRRFEVALGADQEVFTVRSPSLKILAELETVMGTFNVAEDGAAGTPEFGQLNSIVKILWLVLQREPEYKERFPNEDTLMDFLETPDLPQIMELIPRLFKVEGTADEGEPFRDNG